MQQKNVYARHRRHLLAVVVTAATLVPCWVGPRSAAAEDARVQSGKLWYDTYCTPCHGAGGAPGSAVLAETGKRIDLRTYEKRNGGTFPSWKWWDVTFNPHRSPVHAGVWEKIRNDQGDKLEGTSELSRELERDIRARGVVATIEYYVLSIQRRKE